VKTYRIAAIPGDGIGNEVIPAGIEVLDALAGKGGFQARLRAFRLELGALPEDRRLHPEGGLEKLKAFDAIFFGAVGAPDVPDHITLWGLRLPICQGFDQYANVRPTRILPGIVSPLRNVAARTRLGDRARELRGRVCRARRARAPRPARGESPPRFPSSRARASSASCASPSSSRARPRKLLTRGHEVERPAPRHGAVGRDRREVAKRISRREGTRCWSTP
jgi:tartrate dehydrogenase/decarboxylase / D-malate dehydrogenase